jgi:hypothetical protein
MIVPELKGDGWDRSRLSTSYIEGFFGLPENSISDEPREGLTEVEFLGYVQVGKKVKRSADEPVTKLNPAESFVTPSADEPVTKLNPAESFVTPSADEPVTCLCGCGISIQPKKTGRYPKFASGACRTRYHRSK